MYIARINTSSDYSNLLMMNDSLDLVLYMVVIFCLMVEIDLKLLSDGSPIYRACDYINVLVKG